MTSTVCNIVTLTRNSKIIFTWSIVKGSEIESRMNLRVTLEKVSRCLRGLILRKLNGPDLGVIQDILETDQLDNYQEDQILADDDLV